MRINGVDVFHPNTGEVRSDGAEGIACWFVDTDYNEESFFVRHAYFLGANDPYKALKTTLKAEIDPRCLGHAEQRHLPPLPTPRLRPHRRQGHQPPRRRGDEGVSGVESVRHGWNRIGVASLDTALTRLLGMRGVTVSFILSSGEAAYRRMHPGRALSNP